MRDTVTWSTFAAAQPAHEQLCVVCLAGSDAPRVLKFNDDDETGTYWYDPTLPLVWGIETHQYDYWAPAPMAPVAPLQPRLAVAS